MVYIDIKGGGCDIFKPYCVSIRQITPLFTDCFKRERGKSGKIILCSECSENTVLTVPIQCVCQNVDGEASFSVYLFKNVLHSSKAFAIDFHVVFFDVKHHDPIINKKTM